MAFLGGGILVLPGGHACHVIGAPMMITATLHARTSPKMKLKKPLEMPPKRARFSLSCMAHHLRRWDDSQLRA